MDQGPCGQDVWRDGSGTAGEAAGVPGGCRWRCPAAVALSMAARQVRMPLGRITSPAVTHHGTAIEMHLNYGAQLPTGHSTMHLYPIDSAASQVPQDATASAYRDGGWAASSSASPRPGQRRPDVALGQGLLGGAAPRAVRTLLGRSSLVSGISPLVPGTVQWMAGGHEIGSASGRGSDHDVRPSFAQVPPLCAPRSRVAAPLRPIRLARQRRARRWISASAGPGMAGHRAALSSRGCPAGQRR